MCSAAREFERICLVVNDLPSAESKGAVPVRRGPPSECARAHLAPEEEEERKATLSSSSSSSYLAPEKGYNTLTPPCSDTPKVLIPGIVHRVSAEVSSAAKHRVSVNPCTQCARALVTRPGRDVRWALRWDAARRWQRWRRRRLACAASSLAVPAAPVAQPAAALRLAAASLAASSLAAASLAASSLAAASLAASSLAAASLATASVAAASRAQPASDLALTTGSVFSRGDLAALGNVQDRLVERRGARCGSMCCRRRRPRRRLPPRRRRLRRPARRRHRHRRPPPPSPSPSPPSPSPPPPSPSPPPPSPCCRLHRPAHRLRRPCCQASGRARVPVGALGAPRTAAAGGSPRQPRGTLEGAQRAVHRRRLRPTTPRRCGSSGAALVARRRSPARWSSHTRSTTACKGPRARGVVQTPEPHSGRAMGAALTRPTSIASASTRSRACGV